MALAQIRKEIAFCQKTDTKVLGIIENMSFFHCPKCHEETKIYNFEGEGALKLCMEFKIDLLGKIPLDPKLIYASDKGKSIVEIDSTGSAGSEYLRISDKLLNIFKIDVSDKK